MIESQVRLYDGLFLMSQGAVTDIGASIARVREILEYRGAEIVSVRKWDERRLAYPVRGHKRGTYILALFRVKGDQVTVIERDCELSDDVLRVLVTRADHYGEVEIDQEIKASQVTDDEAALRGEGADDEQGAAVGASAEAEAGPDESDAIDEDDDDSDD